MSSETHRKSKINRRNYLRALGTTGLAAGCLNTQRVSADESSKNNVEIVSGWVHTNRGDIRNGAPPKKEKIYDKIPAEEYRLTQAAHKKAIQIQDDIDNKFGDNLIKVGVTTDEPGSKKLRVNYTTHRVPVYQEKQESSGKEKYEEHRPNIKKSRIRSEVPERASSTASANGKKKEYWFDVEVVDRTRTYTAEYNSTYRPVPGGCQIEIKAEPGTAPVATATCPIYHNDKSEWQILTAGHLFTENSGSDDIMQPVDGAYNDKQIGTGDIKRFDSNDGDVKFDAGTVSINVDWTRKLAGKDGTYSNYIAHGNVSWDKISQEEGNENYTVKKQGRTTGRKSGYINEVFPSDKEFRTSINAKRGDSGGPFFVDYKGDDVLMMGLVSWGSDKQDGEYQHSGGFSIERVEDELPLSI